MRKRLIRYLSISLTCTLLFAVNTHSAQAAKRQLTADFNQDDFVDVTDYSTLAKDYFKTGNTFATDINIDGFVDTSDYKELVDQFLLTTEYTEQKIGVIGDYGADSLGEAKVATMISSWNPDLVITLGDNNYNLGEASTIDPHIGKYYSNFIYPYKGTYGSTATFNKFFPSLGNHDWNTTNAQPYLDYFTLPGNERYYDFIRGDIHFFVLDSDFHDPDGTTYDSVQGKWFQAKIAKSTAAWQIVYFHHPPYSSDTSHGPTVGMQWPFASLGVDVVLAGHAHTYERLLVDGIPYFVNGLGGAEMYQFKPTPQAQSAFRFTGEFGAQLITASRCKLRLDFMTVSQPAVARDSFSLKRCNY